MTTTIPEPELVRRAREAVESVVHGGVLPVVAFQGAQSVVEAFELGKTAGYEAGLASSSAPPREGVGPEVAGRLMCACSDAYGPLPDGEEVDIFVGDIRAILSALGGQS